MNDEAISPREVLRTAANATGGEERLAALLEIDLTDLKAWLDGTRPTPFGTCIDALVLLERHRQPPRRELRGSLERLARMAGTTGLIFAVGLCLFSLMH